MNPKAAAATNSQSRSVQKPLGRVKRLRGFLADRPAAVAALTKIFISRAERLLYAAAGVTSDANTPTAARPRLGAVSYLHRFGSAINHHVHLRASSDRRRLHANW